MEVKLRPLIIYLMVLIKIFLYKVILLECKLIIGKFLLAYKYIIIIFIIIN